MRPYLASYNYNGSCWSIEIMADSFQDVRERPTQMELA